MAGRLNITPKHAADLYALNRAEQRREARGATAIPTTRKEPKSGSVTDAVDTAPARSLVEAREGGPSNTQIAQAFWGQPSPALDVLARGLAAGPIHMKDVLDTCAVVAARDAKAPDPKWVRDSVRMDLERALIGAAESSTDPV